MDKIRNFSIIAHIDHGKSTLADRFLQKTGMVSDRAFHDQILDSMDIEQERGITIKSRAVTMPYKAADGVEYTLNLIDTPGHVDFTYEVSRSLASCDGALILVDATQGVEAQTLANLFLALEHNLEIIPIINKIDLPSADIEWCKQQIEEELGLDSDDAIAISAKMGTGIEEVLEAIVKKIEPPVGDVNKPLQTLIFDSSYDAYRGAVIYCRVFNGELKAGDVIMFMSSKTSYRVEEVGIFGMERIPRKVIRAGDVGYIIAGIKTVSDISTGDTITLQNSPCAASLPGFKEIKPVVFSSIYPVSSDDYMELNDAMEKLKLNDASLVYEKDSSTALGFGFRCGFLGLLHLEIVQQRLEQEFNQSLVITAPSVQYRITLKNQKVLFIDNPAVYPDPATIEQAEEPFIRANIMTPEKYVGNIISLCIDKRGIQTSINYLGNKRMEIVYELPLGEIVYDFYDRLKSISQGYASFDYDIIDFRPTDLVKLDILVAGEKVDALSILVHRDNAVSRARKACKNLKDEIPRQMFKVPIQGSINGKIIARETISAFRKDVTAKCYGGDISRKRKLLEKQKEGKKRMKMAGSVELPQSAFLAVLKSGDD